AMNNLALDRLFDPNPSATAKEEALELTRRVLEDQPNQGIFHTTRAYAFAAVGRKNEAVAEMNRAVAVDPEDVEIRAMLPLIQAGHTIFSGFKAQGPVRFWIAYEYGWLHILIAVPTIVILAIAAVIYRKIRRRQESLPGIQSLVGAIQ